MDPTAPPTDDQNAPVPPPTPPTPPKLKEQAPNIPTPPNFPPVEMSSVTENADAIAKKEGDEYWENYAREIELEKKILEMGGIEKVESGEVSVPENIAKEMGIKPAVTAETPIAKVTDFSVRGVSLSDDQIGTGLKKPTSSGFRWLVEWFIYQLLKAHFVLKKVKGKILRQKMVS